ncbi:MAG: DUF3343 domain-containing protein [Clostridiales bacterium]|nr:DUF3343 domain-containing protein [Clostridiales bacterium]
MPVKKLWLIISFFNVTEALRAEKLFAAAGIGGLLIPTPRSLSASCGLCWRTEIRERPAIEAHLAAHRLQAESVTEILM